MTLESMLIYGLSALGGWLLRHVGVGANLNVPGGTAAKAATPSANVPLLATLKTDIDQIVKSAVEAAVKQALDDFRGAAGARAAQP